AARRRGRRERARRGHGDLHRRPRPICREHRGAEGRVSDEPAGSGADGVDAGKRLIRLGGDRGLSLADRVAERFRRLAWRTPIYGRKLRGRHPLKLIAVADDPFLGDPARGNALLEGILLFRGEELPLVDLDFAKLNVSKPFVEYLHAFGWLRDLSTVAT